MQLMTRIYIALWVAALLVLAACAPQTPPVPEGTASPSSTRTGEFVPYYTPTPSTTPEPPSLTPTPLPSPTATPRQHTISLGEDLFGIALRYQVTLDELLQLNPDVEPHLLKVGQVLLVPAPSQLGSVTPQPTPMQLPLDPPDCQVTAEGGVWCFVVVRNPQEAPVESVSVSFRLAGEDGQVHTQVGYAALNLLPAGGSLPALAYFPPPVPAPEQASAEVLAAVPAAAAQERYLPVTVEGGLDELTEDGMALVRGEVILSETASTASQVWVAAAGYDEQGRLVAVRRREQSGLALAAGERLAFEMALYNPAGEISRVELWAEARP